MPLSIPPEAMDQGLFGELSVLPVTLLSPCVLQYPNLSTQLTHIQISFSDFTITLFVTFMVVESVCCGGLRVACPLSAEDVVQLTSADCDCQCALGRFPAKCESGDEGQHLQV